MALKVLIIGLGSIAKKHIDALRKIDENIQIYGLRSEKNSQKVQGVEDIFFYEDIPNIKPDFIIVSNPTGEHYQTLKKISAYNIPLFIEKPLFSRVDNDSESLVRFFSRMSIPTYVACNLRFLDCLNEIRRLIAGKRINEVNVYCGSYLPDWRPDVDFRKNYSANKEMGGGVHIDLIHELDYTSWIFGKPRITKAMFSNNSSLGITAYDYANYLWKYDDYSASIILNYYRRDGKRQLEIVTSEITYLVNLRDNTIINNGLLVFQSSQSILDTYEAQMRFFMDNILSKKEKFNTIQEAYEILKLCIRE